MRHWLGNGWTWGFTLLAMLVLWGAIPALAQERVVVYTTFELARMGLLDPYKPAHWDKIPAQFKGADGTWVAVDLFVGAFGINTAQMQQRNLPVSRSYKDLADPR